DSARRSSDDSTQPDARRFSCRTRRDSFRQPYDWAFDQPAFCLRGGIRYRAAQPECDRVARYSVSLAGWDAVHGGAIPFRHPDVGDIGPLRNRLADPDWGERILCGWKRG